VTFDALAIARQLAAAHPEARLPCPVCAGTVGARNLDGHLVKVHPGASAAAMAPPWRGKGALGVAPCSLELVGAAGGDALVLRHWLGLARRAVTLPCALEAGALTAIRSDAIMASYADDMNVGGETVKVGRYLRLRGERSITIGCRGGARLASHWARTAWSDGKPARSCDLVVAREAMVAIELALAARGMLVPR
jgi:hypothetical protein